MSKKISVIVKDPGKVPRHVYISDTHENLKQTVGGEVDEILIASDLVILCNRDQTGAPCCNVFGRDFAGTIVFCGIGHQTEDDADELTDIPMSFKQFKQLFASLWK